MNVRKCISCGAIIDVASFRNWNIRCPHCDAVQAIADMNAAPSIPSQDIGKAQLQLFPIMVTQEEMDLILDRSDGKTLIQAAVIAERIHEDNWGLTRNI